MTGATAWLLLVLFWGAAAMAGGGLLARLARRIHPSLSLRRLWLFYTALLGLAGAVVLAAIWR